MSLENIARQLQGIVLTESEANELIDIIKVRVRGPTSFEGLKRAKKG